MTAAWLKKVKSLPAKTILHGFSKNHPPAPWNMIQALKMCGMKFVQVVDTFGPHGPMHGPRYVVNATIEECTGSDMLIAALTQGGYGNCPLQHIPLAEIFPHAVHAGAEVSMKAVLDYGLEITSAQSIGPDHNDKTQIALVCTLPLETVVQHEMAQVILAELQPKGKKK